MASAEEKSPPEKKLYPDGGWGWVCAIGSAFAHFLVVGLGRCFGLFYLVLLDKFQQSKAATSLVVALYNTHRQMLGPVAGFLVDRYTCRRVVFAGGIVMLIGCVISAFANSILYLYISFGVITGIGGALIFSPSYIIVGQYFDKKKGKAMGLATVGAGFGTVALAPIITLLLKEYSFFGAMFIMGALQFNNCVCGSLFRPLPQWSRQKKKSPPKEEEMTTMTSLDDTTANGDTLAVHNDHDVTISSVEQRELVPKSDTGEKETVAVKKEEKSSCCNLGDSFTILKNRTFVLYGLQIVAMSICVQSFLTFLPGIAMEAGVDAGPAAMLLSITGLADMGGRFLWGFIFDFKAVRSRRRLFHALLGLPVGGFTIVTGLMGSFWGFAIMSVLFGIVEGGFHSQRATVVSEFVAKEQMSSTVGWVICFQGVGNMLGPPVAGALRDINSDYGPSYYFAGLCLMATCTLFLIDYCWIAARRRSQRSAENHTV